MIGDKRVVIGSETNEDRKIDLTSNGSQVSVPVTVYDSSGAVVSFGGATTPTSVADNRKTVTTPGTAVALASSTTCKRIHIQALDTNTNPVVVGGSTVVAASGTRRGIALLPYNSITLSVDNLSDVYVDAVTAGEGVSFLYEI